MLTFCGSWALFLLGVASQSQSCWAGEWGCDFLWDLGDFLFGLFGILQAVGVGEGLLLSFGFLLCKPKSKRVFFFFCLSKSVFQNNLKRQSSFITAGITIISRKIGDKHFLLSEKDGPLCLNKSLLFLFQLPWQQDLGLDQSALLGSGGLCGFEQIG